MEACGVKWLALCEPFWHGGSDLHAVGVPQPKQAATATSRDPAVGSQGKEADIVIFSCVRAHDRRSGVGFLADVRRMNVALTRARRSLWIIGHSATLKAWASASL